MIYTRQMNFNSSVRCKGDVKQSSRLRRAESSHHRQHRVYTRDKYFQRPARNQCEIPMTYTSRERIWNSEIGDDLPIGSEGGRAPRRPRSNFRFGIFGSIRNPFSRCRRAALGTAFDECGYPACSLPSLTSSTHPRPHRHPSRPILLLALECDKDTPRGEKQTWRGGMKERSGEKELTSKWILIVLLVAPRDRR